jgi:hypothetical protein
MDRSIEHQQNYVNLHLGLVVLIAKTNRYQETALLIPVLNDLLHTLVPGQLVKISA